MEKIDGFTARELLGNAYWDDSRWKKVAKLRKENKQLEANSLVLEIHRSWGLE